MAATFPFVTSPSWTVKTLYSAGPMVAASGFRAYIAKDTSRKRSLELAQKEEDVGGNSSGSDRTASIELHGGGKVGMSAGSGFAPLPCPG